MDASNERLQAEDRWIFAGGLASPGTATVIGNRDGEAIAPDRPFLGG